MVRVPFSRLASGFLWLLLTAAVVTGAFVAWRTFRPEPVGRHTRIIVVFKSTDPKIVFWQIVKAGVESAAKEFDVDVRVVGPMEEKDINGEIRMVEAAVAQHPAAIVLAADDERALVPAAREVRAARIKLVTIDSGLIGNLSSSFVATDNVAAAEKAGTLVARLLHGKGTVAMVSYVKGTTTAIERRKGVAEALRAYPHVKIVGTYYSEDLVGEAYDITKRLLTESSPPRALVALNEVATVGAAEAVADLHMKNRVILIGFDNSPIETNYLESGVIKGIVLQKPFNIGYLGVACAVHLLEGRTVPRRIDTGSLLVTKEDMYDRASQKLLFPLVGH